MVLQQAYLYIGNTYWGIRENGDICIYIWNEHSVLLSLQTGNDTMACQHFQHYRPVMPSCDDFFNIIGLDKLLNQQSRCRWSETSCMVTVMFHIYNYPGQIAKALGSTLIGQRIRHFRVWSRSNRSDDLWCEGVDLFAGPCTVRWLWESSSSSCSMSGPTWSDWPQPGGWPPSSS